MLAVLLALSLFVVPFVIAGTGGSGDREPDPAPLARTAATAGVHDHRDAGV